MKTKWYKDCKTQEAKQERAALYLSCHQILKVLRNMIQDDIEAVRKNTLAKEHYGQAAWPFLQADQIGELRALNNVLELLPEEGKE